MEKKCVKCGQQKSLSEYHKYKRSFDGVRSMCKTCRKLEYEQSTIGAIAFRRRGTGWISKEEEATELKTGMRRCSLCKKLKPLTMEFFTKTKKGLCRQCKDCKNIQCRQHHNKIKDIPEHKERMLENQRCYQENNRESHLERYRRYRRKHTVKIAAYSKQRRKEHPEKVRKWWQDWYDENGKAHNRSQNARKRDLGAYVGVNIIRAVETSNIKKYGILTCEYCKVPVGSKYHLEHKTPISRGGRSQRVNLCIACPECNLSKGTLTAVEYRKRLKVI